MTNCATFDDLPEWFRADMAARDKANKIYETTHLGRRWCCHDAMMIAVDGLTWAIGNAAEGVFTWTEAQSPKHELTPLAPVAYDAGSASVLASLAAKHPDFVRYVVPMGHDIYVTLGLYLLVSDAFGDRLQWLGTGPTSPAVARVDGDLVAIVMPCRYSKTNQDLETNES